MAWNRATIRAYSPHWGDTEAAARRGVAPKRRVGAHVRENRQHQRSGPGAYLLSLYASRHLTCSCTNTFSAEQRCSSSSGPFRYARNPALTPLARWASAVGARRRQA